MDKLGELRVLVDSIVSSLSLFFSASLSMAGTAADFSGANGGSVIVGEDSESCDSSKSGAIRYNSSTSCAEFCDGSAWVCPNSGPPAFSGPTYRSLSTANTTSVTSVTINKPAGTVQNDLMIAFLSRDASGSNMPPPSGWTQLIQNDIGTTHRAEIFYKIAGASEPASYSFDLIDTNEGVVGTIVTVTGASTSSPFGPIATEFDLSSSYIKGGSISQTSSTLIFLVSFHESPGTLTTPFGHTLLSYIDRLDAGLGITYRENTATGASGDIYWFHTAADDWRSYQIEIQP